jgi:hypothetical protein
MKHRLTHRVLEELAPLYQSALDIYRTAQCLGTEKHGVDIREQAETLKGKIDKIANKYTGRMLKKEEQARRDA